MAQHREGTDFPRVWEIAFHFEWICGFHIRHIQQIHGAMGRPFGMTIASRKAQSG